MAQNTYSLPELIDFALRIPVDGVVNFNILHTILQTIVTELELTDVRPACDVEGSAIGKVALEHLKKIQEKLPDGPSTRKTKIEQKDERYTVLEKISSDKSVHPTPERKDSEIQTEEVETEDVEVIQTPPKEILELKDDDTETEKSELEKKSIESFPHPPKTDTESETTKEIESKSSDVTQEPKDVDFETENMEVEDIVEALITTITKEKKSAESISHPSEAAIEPETHKDIESKELKEILTATKEILEIQEDKIHEKVENEDLPKHASEKSTISAKKTIEGPISHTPELPIEPEKKAKKSVAAGRGTEGTVQQWKFLDMNQRVRATEEGLYRISNIVDRIAEQMARSAQRRREGGPASEELESIDDRLLALEDFSDQFAADHKLLMEMHQRLLALLKEFEELKALADLLKQMRIDISKKADKEETWAALELKADVALVDSKVDRFEFETAIEELGEAIGLLGLKFRRKNDEWEERAAEIWEAIDSKMTFDVFEAARIKIESRLTALMYGLRKLKKVVEDLLYPEASGVTRCILCRRPACISGLECMEGIKIGDSPKRPLSARSSGDNENAQILRRTSDAAIAKKQKLDVPPYSKNPDTIIRIPYRSASYRSSRDDKINMNTAHMKLQPVVTDRDSKESSQVPKLPNIYSKKAKSSPKSNSLMRSKKTPQAQKSDDLHFTKIMLARAKERERKQSLHKDTSYKFTANPEVDPSKRPGSATSSKSSVSNVDLTPDPSETLKEFPPARKY